MQRISRQGDIELRFDVGRSVQYLNRLFLGINQNGRCWFCTAKTNSLV